jgi:hypothetical protein
VLSHAAPRPPFFHPIMCDYLPQRGLKWHQGYLLFRLSLQFCRALPRPPSMSRNMARRTIQAGRRWLLSVLIGAAKNYGSMRPSRASIITSRWLTLYPSPECSRPK